MDAQELLRRYAAGERDFSKARLRGIMLDMTDLKDINLSGADLSGADLSGADLSGANLSGARLCEGIFIKVNFSGADLSGADLTYSGIIKSNFTKAILDGAKMGGEGGVIEDSCFDKASLRGATFIMASIGHTTMRDAVLDGTSFGGDYFFSDLDLTGASLKGSDFILPEYIPPGGGRIILPDGRILGSNSSRV